MNVELQEEPFLSFSKFLGLHKFPPSQPRLVASYILSVYYSFTLVSCKQLFASATVRDAPS